MKDSLPYLHICHITFDLAVCPLLQGFNQEDLEGEKEQVKKKQQVEEESDSDEGVDRSGQE